MRDSWETVVGEEWETVVGEEWETVVGEEWETVVGEEWETIVGELRDQRLGAHPYDCGIATAALFIWVCQSSTTMHSALGKSRHRRPCQTIRYGDFTRIGLRSFYSTLRPRMSSICSVLSHEVRCRINFIDRLRQSARTSPKDSGAPPPQIVRDS